MNPMYNQIITKLVEMGYAHFVNFYKFKNAIIYLVGTYALRNQLSNMYREETYQQMIQQALISICNLVSTQNFDAQKQPQFINWTMRPI